MNFYKNLLRITIILAVVYIVIGIVSEAFIYYGRNFIERETSRILSLDKIKLHGILCIPLTGFYINKLEFSGQDIGEVVFRRVLINYNIFSIPSGGIVSALKSIRVKDITYNSDQVKTGNLIAKIKKYLDLKIKNLAFVLDLERLNARIDPGGGVIAAVSAGKVNIMFSYASISYRSTLSALIKSPETVFLNSALDLKLDIDPLKGRLKGDAYISNLNIGGIPFLQGRHFKFKADTNSTFIMQLTDIISSTNGNIIFHSSGEFVLAGRKHGTNYILSELLSSGGYNYRANGYFEQNGNFYANMNIGSTDWKNSDAITFSALKNYGKIRITMLMDSAVAGKAKINLNMTAESGYLPSGTINLAGSPFLSGALKTDILLEFVPGNKVLDIFASGIKLNGGYIGTAYTRMIFGNSCLLLDKGSSETYYNTLLTGFISNNNYRIGLIARDIEGPTVVSNIYFNVLEIGKCRYNGVMVISNDSEGLPLISANASGYRDGYGKWVDLVLKYDKGLLTFPEIKMVNSGINIDVAFKFDIRSDISNFIYINGNINYIGKTGISMKGFVTFDNIKNSTSVKMTFDNDVFLENYNEGKKDSLKISSRNLNLSKLGFNGIADFIFNADFYNNKINYISINGALSLYKRKLGVEIKADTSDGKGKGKLIIDNLLINDQSDRLKGNGTLWFDGDYLMCQIGFNRGGGLSLRSSAEEINASVDLRNFNVSDIPSDGKNALVSARIVFFGPLINPDFTGSINIVNAPDSPDFRLSLPFVNRIATDWKLKQAVLQSGDFLLKADSGLVVSSSGVNIFSSGEADYGDLLKSRYTFNFSDHQNKGSLDYELTSLSLSGIKLSNMSGRIAFDGPYYSMDKKGPAGLSGNMKIEDKSGKWDINFYNGPINCISSGEYNDGMVKSDLSLNLPLEYLSKLKIFSFLKGDIALNINAKGTENHPVYSGILQIRRTFADFQNINSTIRDLNIKLDISNSKINFVNSVLPASIGNLVLNGYIDISDIMSPLFKITLHPEDKNKSTVNLNINKASYRINGDAVIRELAVTGDLHNIIIGGDILARNVYIQVPIEFNPSSSENGNPIKINWELPVTIGDGVKFDNNIINVVLAKTGTLGIYGSTEDNSFTLKGVLGVSTGTVSFLGKDFTINSGSVNFEGKPGDLMPYINFNSTYSYLDTARENVIVYLIFEGKVPKIYPSDFHSVPDKSKDELSAQLGLNSQFYATNSGMQSAAGQTFLYGGVNMAENALIFSPVTMDLKRRLGLDIFNVRSGVLENLLTNQINTNQSYAEMFSGTSFTIGKYIFPGVMVEYGLMIGTSPYSINELVPLSSVGLDFNLYNSALEWKLQQTNIPGTGIGLQQQIQFNFNSRF